MIKQQIKKDTLKNNSKNKKDMIIKNMKYDAVEDDLANKNTEDFIRRMYRNNVS